MQNFVRFHAIEPKIELSQEMWEKRQHRSLLRYMYPNCIIVLSNDRYFEYKFLCKFLGFWKRISFINRRCFTVNGSTVLIFVLMKSQFDLLLKDAEIAKKYEFIVENRKKKLKFGFFDNFALISGNIRRFFSALRPSTIYNKRHVLRNFFKNSLKILRMAIFFFPFL